MGAEATETSGILYETLAPLGEDDDGQSLGQASYSRPLNASDSQAAGDRLAGVVTSGSLSVDVISRSTSPVSVSTGENYRSGIGQTPASYVVQSEKSVVAGAILDNEQETCISAKRRSISTEKQKDISSFTLEIVENGRFGTETFEVSSSRNHEEIGFLSLEPEDPVDNDQEQVLIAEEKNLTLFHGVNKAPKEAPPWARTLATHGTWFRSPFLQLHQEIVDFCNFVTPTEKEQKIRDDAVQRVREVVLTIWPSCQVKVFGSFATGLYLPTSDVDVVILESGCQVPQDGLKALSKALNRKNLVKNLQVIGKARVPIVKFLEAESNIPFDISFDVPNGPEAADFIKAAMENLPPLKPLCMVLKIFLQQRELNEVYTGGIGSYALLVMLLTHLQMHPSRKNTNSRGEPCPLESNLGILLVDFFDFYGRALNVRDVGISCRTGGRFYSKRSHGFADIGRPYLLSVEDPQKPDNDIGKNSYNVMKVRSAFVLAHRLLTKLEAEGIPEHVGLLGRIVRMDKELTRREVVLPELPPRLHSAMKVPGNPSSSGVSNEKDALDPELGGGLRWNEDEEFPRGGELDQSSRKRRRTTSRAEKSAVNDDSLRIHKRKRSEGPQVDESLVSSSLRVQKAKLRKNSQMYGASLSNHESKRTLRERLEPVEKPVGKEKSSKQRKSSKRDNLGPETDVEEHSTHLKRSNKRSKHYQREDSHEEGEITLEDDARLALVGNGHNKHKRWSSDSGKSRNRHKREKNDGFLDPRIHEVINEGSRSNRKVLVTNSHKKVTYL